MQSPTSCDDFPQFQVLGVIDPRQKDHKGWNETTIAIAFGRAPMLNDSPSQAVDTEAG